MMEYITGININVTIVETDKPPITVIPSVFHISEPVLLLNAIGSIPKIVVKVVIKIIPAVINTERQLIIGINIKKCFYMTIVEVIIRDIFHE